jgi:hypothetical protein
MFMTQTQGITNSDTTANQALGIAAAAAATATSDQTAAASETNETDEGDEVDASGKRTRVARKIFVVVGEIHEFDSALKAEKFINAEGSPTTYAVLRGNRIGTSTKVSLR